VAGADWSLRKRIATHTKKSGKDKSDRSYNGEIQFVHCRDSIYLQDSGEAYAVCWDRSIELMLHPQVVHAFRHQPEPVTRRHHFASNGLAGLCCSSQSRSSSKKYCP
jgi:hypothetical protein